MHELQIPGFTPSETSSVLRMIYDRTGHLAKSAGIQDADFFGHVRTTAWPTLNKAVEGGLEHVVSVDNGANYAELWHKGGNWYAVTGAENKVDKSVVGFPESISLIKGVVQGMPITEVMPLFLMAVNEDCGCNGRSN